MGNLGEGKKRDYGKLQSPEGIKKSSEGIRIIHESTGQDKIFQEAHKLIENAENIYFLGFGYHEDNLNRLHLKRLIYEDILPKKSLSGTTYGLNDAKNRFIQNYFEGCGFNGFNVSTLSFLENNIDLE